MGKKILVTGFDPFGGSKINAAWEAVSRLPEEIEGTAIIKAQIPTVFGKGAERAIFLAEENCADVVLLVGQAGGRKEITPEVIAINLRDAAICDNEGNKPYNQKIAEGGDAAYFATIPVHEIVSILQEEDYPARLSYSAGAFVCNDAFYLLSKHFAGTKTRVGFIHIPSLPEQGEPSLPAEKTLATLTRILEWLFT
ncbi:MAG: pyroglutamyl-peptidase I [Christensenellales bacterium]|jgi:pyroglutamyl-peptidase